jgi:PPOX class probable F420-dependent enzyme
VSPALPEPVPESLSETARRLLDEPNFAVIATLMPDGSPQTSAVWVARTGDDSVTFATTPTIKLANIRRDPRVSVTVYHREDPYLELNLRGRVTSVDSSGGVALIDELSMLYYGKFPYPYHKPGEAWFAVTIEIERWRTNRD